MERMGIYKGMRPFSQDNRQASIVHPIQATVFVFSMLASLGGSFSLFTPTSGESIKKNFQLLTYSWRS
jgi:hypothetical protein